jgi:hypothetical protein
MLNTKCVYVRSGVKIMLGLVLKVLTVIVSLLPLCRGAPLFLFVNFLLWQLLMRVLIRRFSSCILGYIGIRGELILAPRYVIQNSGTHLFHGLIWSWNAHESIQLVSAGAYVVGSCLYVRVFPWPVLVLPGVVACNRGCADNVWLFVP